MSNTIEISFPKAGLQTNLQDLGRWGHQHLGIPVGGAMDTMAAQQANWLVGNNFTTPLLEITLMGPTVEIKGNAQIAITGAHLSPKIEKQKVPMYQTISLKHKTTLHFGRLKKGCRTYLAIGGTWKVEQWLSSCSPILVGEASLLPQSFIHKDDRILIQSNQFIQPRKIAKQLRPKLKRHINVRVFPGPEFEQFSKTSIAAFFSWRHSISNDSNRMGYRLKTILPTVSFDTELISSGIVPGTIQVSNAGQPILLMKDAPTTGGYHRIANIHSEDLDKVAQLKPNDSISFILLI